MTYTNYNQLMLEALHQAKELGITEQKELDELATEIFRADSAKKS